MKPAIEDQFTGLVRKGKISRQRAYQLRQRDRGLCLKCASPRVTKCHCLRHAVYERERQRTKHEAIDTYNSKVRQLERTFVPPPLEQLPAA